MNTNVESILNAIKTHPGLSYGDISDIVYKGRSKSCAATLKYLVDINKIKREGSYGNYKYYLTNVSDELPSVATVATTSTLTKYKKLCDYDPRELLEELKRRGYVWDKMWVETRSYVNYNNI